MDSAHGTAALPAVGFPIRTSPDQSLVSGSPTLFAATHVLRRLLSPRHPSCALCSLVIVSLPPPLLHEDQGPARLPWLTGSLCRTTTLLLRLRICGFQRTQILVEPIGIEPTTSSLQSWRSPS